MLYVVVAVLNNGERLGALLTSLGEAAQVAQLPMRIVLVDNGSQDDLANGLAQSFAGRNSGVQVIYNERNTGAAAAWNLGIRFALVNGASQILVCGSDTCPLPSTVERLVAHANAGVPFITGTAIPYDANESVMIAPPPVSNESVLIAAPDFSFFLITVQAIEAVARWDGSIEFNVVKETGPADRPPVLTPPWCWGLFDERYWPSYFEDNDYHLRLERAGILAARDPEALFRHDCSLTIRTHPDLAKVNQEKTFANNAELFRAKWGGLPTEVGAVGARPLNVTDEQWQQMSGGRPVLEIDRGKAIEDARETYRRYGILVG